MRMEQCPSCGSRGYMSEFSPDPTNSKVCMKFQIHLAKISVDIRLSKMSAENEPREKGQKGVFQLQDFKYNSVEKI